MSFQQADGKGRGYRVGVNKYNKALTLAESNPVGHYVSLREGLLFNWVSEDDDAVAADMIFYLKNDDVDRDIVVDLIRLSSENAATFKIWEVTGTAAGSNAITAKNLNLGSGVTQSSNYTSRGDGAVTGLSTSGSMIAVARVPADDHKDIPFDDTLIIPVGRAIAVEYDTGTTGDAEVLLRGYFIDTGEQE